MITKLKKELDKIEIQLKKVRTSAIDDGWQTQRFAKKSRSWDLLAIKKIELLKKIEEYENSI